MPIAIRSCIACRSEDSYHCSTLAVEVVVVLLSLLGQTLLAESYLRKCHRRRS